jgi:N-terminal half of MaoC dehydratase
MAQLPPVLVCGVAVLVELEADPVELEEVELALEVSEDDELDVESLAFDDVAAVVLFALDAVLSLQAIAPPNERAVAMLSAATARRARWARGLRRSVIGGSSGRGSRSGPTVRTPGKTAVSADVRSLQNRERRGGAVAVERFPIEAGHILMFARSIGDPNPIYADEEYAAGTEVGGIVAPPTFAQASAQFDPDYFLRPKVGEPWFGSGKEPTGVKPKESSGGGGGGGGGGGLHAEQHFTYHRHIRPGDVLTGTVKPGKTWEKEGKRSGKLVFSESITEYRDQHGELVITARGVGVRTERVVES